MTDTSTPKKEFDFCFWGKLIVAIPAIPMIAFIAASFFSNTYAQLAAAAFAVGSTAFLAVKIDGMQCFAGKVVKRKDAQ